MYHCTTQLRRSFLPLHSVVRPSSFSLIRQHVGQCIIKRGGGGGGCGVGTVVPSINKQHLFHSHTILKQEHAIVPSNLTSKQIAQKLENVQIESFEHDSNRGFFPYRVLGNETTAIEIDLQPGESIRAETGSLVYMEQGVEIETSTGGGFGQGLKRMMTGESFFISDFINKGENLSKVCLAAAFPSKIIPINLAEHGGSLVCQKGAFLCGATTTQFEMYSQHSLGAGFFGGEGFILQQLSGDGLVLLRAGGSLILKELKEGETLKTSSGTLVAFEPSVTFGIERLPGVKNMIFGGEGIFLPTLTGPGKVWLQSLPFNRLVDSIAGSIKTGGYGALGGLGSGAGAGASGSSGENAEGEEDAVAEGEEEEVIEDEDNGYIEDEYTDYVEEPEQSSSGKGFFSSWFGGGDESDSD